MKQVYASQSNTMLYDFKQSLHWLIDNDVGWAYHCFYQKWFYVVT